MLLSSLLPLLLAGLCECTWIRHASRTHPRAHTRAVRTFNHERSRLERPMLTEDRRWPIRARINASRSAFDPEALIQALQLMDAYRPDDTVVKFSTEIAEQARSEGLDWLVDDVNAFARRNGFSLTE